MPNLWFLRLHWKLHFPIGWVSMLSTKPPGRSIQYIRAEAKGVSLWAGCVTRRADEPLVSQFLSLHSTGAVYLVAAKQVPDINYHSVRACDFPDAISLPGWSRAPRPGDEWARWEFATFDRWRAPRANWADRDGSPGSLSRCPRSLGRIRTRAPTPAVNHRTDSQKPACASAKRLRHKDARTKNDDDAASFNWGGFLENRCRFRRRTRCDELTWRGATLPCADMHAPPAIGAKWFTICPHIWCIDANDSP